MLNHPVGCRFSQTLRILVYGRFLVVVGLGIVDEALAITFDLGEIGVRAVVKFFLRHYSEHVPISRKCAKTGDSVCDWRYVLKAIGEGEAGLKSHGCAARGRMNWTGPTSMVSRAMGSLTWT